MAYINSVLIFSKLANYI